MATQPSDMSFSVSDGRGDFEYNGSSPERPVRQPRQPGQPSFHRMVRDLVRFNREAPALIGLNGSGPSLGEFLDDGGYSPRVRGPPDRAPGLGGVVGRPGADVGLPGQHAGRVLRQPRHVRPERPAAMAHGGGRLGAATWSALPAGSATGVRLSHAGAPDRALRAIGWRSMPEGGEPEEFDEVVLATHSDQALAMLGDPSRAGARGARARSPTSPTRRCCTPTARCCRAAAARGRAGTIHLQDEPPAGRPSPTT